MNEDKLTRTLLIESHSAIADAAREAVSRIGVSLRRTPGRVDSSNFNTLDRKIIAALRAEVSKMTLSYPPENQVLTGGEERALRAMKLNSDERGALKKLIADACASTMFRFFCLMDSVGDPDVVKCRSWRGARFTTREEGEMLHDMFSELYWKYKEKAHPSRKKTPSSKTKSKRRSTAGHH